MILLDTNVLIYASTDQSPFLEWSSLADMCACLSPIGPVAFPLLVVRNCQNSHHVPNDTVEQAEWIAVEDVPASFSSEGRPSIGRDRDLLYGMPQLS